MKATLSVLLIGSSITISIIILVSYLEEVGASAPSPSNATDILGYEIQEPGIFLVSNPSSSNDHISNGGAVSANATTAILPNSSTVVYETEAFVVPSTVKTFVIYMANEFHENWPEESHKLLTNKNAYAIPTNLTVSNGTSIAFHMADAPWDIPHDYIVRVVDAHTNETAFETPLLSYPRFNRGPSNSGTTFLPIGEYRMEAYLYGTDKVETKPITIRVIDTSSVDQSSNLTAGFFYSPQRPVANPYDNDGQLHLGHLEYYRQQFPLHGLKIESIHSFHFASCSSYDEDRKLSMPR